MRKISSGLMLSVILALSGASPGSALPIARLAPSAAAPLQDVRIFCYNRYNGRFLHWGPCAPVSYGPRIYCRNVYTGRFLHWGSCY